MNAPNDKNGKTICKGSYVKFKNNLWEVFDWDLIAEGSETDLSFLGDYSDNLMFWLEPRAGNEFPAQWAYNHEIEVTDLQQLHLDI
jgi:hypothetical protein